MQRLIKFIKLDAAKRRLLVKTIFVVALVRLGLWFLSFKTLRSIVARFEEAHGRFSTQAPESLDRLTWALKIAGAFVPAATCLTQALAAKLVLCRNGYRPILRIGATKDESGNFLAHAWLEHDGRIVIGNLPDLYRYISFPEPVDLPPNYRGGPN